MADRPAFPVDCEQIHPILAVADLSAAINFYTQKLGFELGFTWGDPPRTAGVNVGQVSMHLRQGTPAPSGASVYFAVDDVQSYRQAVHDSLKKCLLVGKLIVRIGKTGHTTRRSFCHSL